jgi:hypothetical protein
MRARTPMRTGESLPPLRLGSQPQTNRSVFEPVKRNVGSGALHSEAWGKSEGSGTVSLRTVRERYTGWAGQAAEARAEVLWGTVPPSCLGVLANPGSLPWPPLSHAG